MKSNEEGGPGVLTPDAPPPRRLGIGMRLRNYFLTGLVIAAPLSITIYITWSFIGWVDAWVKPWIPERYNPDHYLPFTVPGFGLIVAVLALIFLGAATANLFGRTIVAYGEMMLDRMPLVRSIYRGLKQIFETVLSQTGNSFQKVGLIEYPRAGLWAIVFVATETKGELVHKAGGEETDLLSVFLPTTPNPTSGFLLFVPRKDVQILDMSVEDGAKLVISGGLVAPPHPVPAATKDRRRTDRPELSKSPQGENGRRSAAE
ncbi:putative membrane protein [Tepidamorphus gemmatus]|uniref:Putative membrane protein n=2 Tax=Tepidamorphus gemmatus TaxID=747076 RepID=A0A4R3MFC4_9HYPH|nr:putative membrane protein [Tepidamorphus gemmatus]